jgi:protein O-GlcNAc transferase
MKRVLSFSLYGNNPVYTIGCIKNAQLHKEFFIDWEMRVYHNDTVPNDILTELSNLGVVLYDTKLNMGFINSLWRFLPITNVNIEYFISRDCDSRISERDVIAVNEWIDSGKSFHIIREHPIGHGWVMNAGMWGAKGNAIPDFYDKMTAYLTANPRNGDKSIDQCFLRDVIHPIAKNDLFLHDEYFNYEGIGTYIKRDRALDNFAFIGESIDEHDNPRGDQRSPIINLYHAR